MRSSGPTTASRSWSRRRAGSSAFLARYGVIVVADHSQSPVEQIADAATPLDDLRLFRSSRRSDPDRCDVAVAASNRAAMAYLLPGARIGRGRGCRPAGGARRRRRHRLPRRRLACGPARARAACASGAGPARPTSAATPGTSRATPPCSTRRSTRTRSSAWRAPSCAPPPGDVIVSAAPGWEFADSGGIHHLGGGSHGSLRAEDSLVPLVVAGFPEREAFPSQPSITDVQPYVCRHFGAPRVSRPHALATTVG